MVGIPLGSMACIGLNAGPSMALPAKQPLSLACKAWAALLAKGNGLLPAKQP